MIYNMISVTDYPNLRLSNGSLGESVYAMAGRVWQLSLTVFRLSDLHFPGTPLAHRSADDIAELAVIRADC